MGPDQNEPLDLGDLLGGKPFDPVAVVPGEVFRAFTNARAADAPNSQPLRITIDRYAGVDYSAWVAGGLVLMAGVLFLLALDRR